MVKADRKAKEEKLLIGIQPVAAALKNNPGSIRLMGTGHDIRNQRVKDLVLMAQDAGIEIHKYPGMELDQLSGFERHQGVVAWLHENTVPEEMELLPLLEAVHGDPLVLVLDGVQDPHNLGACLRTAEAAGVHAVVVPRDRAAGMTPVVRKASAGASEVLPLFQVTNLARTLRAMKKTGIWIVGTSDRSGRSIYEEGLGGPLALVLGSEGRGMRRLTAEQCDYELSIPMAGVIESLNVSVAAGVCLFEIQRQRKKANIQG